MELLFTTSAYPTSWLIRKITGDDCSHCAIRYKDYVVHSDFLGVREIPYRVFIQQNKIIHTLSGPKNAKSKSYILDKYEGKRYDFGGLLYLGLRYLLPNIVPKQNLWQASGMFLCTEFMTEVISSEEDSMITPHKLYKRLQENRK